MAPFGCVSLCAVTREKCVAANTSAGIEASPSQVPGSPSSVGEVVDNSATLSSLALNDSLWEMDQRPNLMRSYRFLEL